VLPQVISADEDAPAETHDAGQLPALDERIDRLRTRAKEGGGLVDGE
jgi:hypothetical protein